MEPESAQSASSEPEKVSPSSAGQDVALVFGSFFMGDSRRDSAAIAGAFPADAAAAAGISGPPTPIEGNSFDFNSLASTKYLVVCTSSMYGNPPKKFLGVLLPSQAGVRESPEAPQASPALRVRQRRRDVLRHVHERSPDG